jgi:hypothetical protein
MQTREIEGGRSEDLLEMDFSQTTGACMTEAKGPDALRKGALNACSLAVLRFECWRRLPLTSSLESLITLLWAHCKRAARRSGLCLGTRLPMRAGTAVLHCTFDFHHRVASSILDGRPTAPRLARRTGCGLALPIHHKVFGGKPGALSLLPVIIIPRGPKEIDPIVLLAIDQRFCIHIARIHEMPFW